MQALSLQTRTLYVLASDTSFQFNVGNCDTSGELFVGLISVGAPGAVQVTVKLHVPDQAPEPHVLFARALHQYVSPWFNVDETVHWLTPTFAFATTDEQLLFEQTCTSYESAPDTSIQFKVGIGQTKRAPLPGLSSDGASSGIHGGSSVVKLLTPDHVPGPHALFARTLHQYVVSLFSAGATVQDLKITLGDAGHWHFN